MFYNPITCTSYTYLQNVEVEAECVVDEVKRRLCDVDGHPPVKDLAVEHTLRDARHPDLWGPEQRNKKPA